MNHIQEAYAQDFARCVAFSMAHRSEASSQTMEMNIAIARGAYDKAAGNVGFSALGNLNILEAGLGMEVTQ